jgi:hypothetical protein
VGAAREHVEHRLAWRDGRLGARPEHPNPPADANVERQRTTCEQPVTEPAGLNEGQDEEAADASESSGDSRRRRSVARASRVNPAAKVGRGQDQASGAFPRQAGASEAFPRQAAVSAACPRQAVGTARSRGPDHRFSSSLDRTHAPSPVIVLDPPYELVRRDNARSRSDQGWTTMSRVSTSSSCPSPSVTA